MNFLQNLLQLVYNFMIYYSSYYYFPLKEAFFIIVQNTLYLQVSSSSIFELQQGQLTVHASILKDFQLAYFIYSFIKPLRRTHQTILDRIQSIKQFYAQQCSKQRHMSQANTQELLQQTVFHQNLLLKLYHFMTYMKIPYLSLSYELRTILLRLSKSNPLLSLEQSDIVPQVEAYSFIFSKYYYCWTIEIQLVLANLIKSLKNTLNQVQLIRQIIIPILNQKEETQKMHQFHTPLKQANQSAKIVNKVTPKTREGDWVCYNCSNLNFSFRKKCNRCKVQTKEQNQQISNYYNTYFPQEFYFLQGKENFPSLENTQAKTNSISPKKIECKQQKTNIIFDRVERTPQRLASREQLPSVSPLVKRYNRHENHSTKESKSKGLFEDDSLWANINLKYLDEPSKEESKTNEISDQIEEIQKIIQRIIL